MEPASPTARLPPPPATTSPSRGADPPLIAYIFSSPLVVKEEETVHAVAELEYKNEQKDVLVSLRDLNKALRWRSCHATVSNFQYMLGRCDVLHFTGHGLRDSVLFEDDKGRAFLMTQRQIQDTFALCAKKPQLVFLSACYSESVFPAFVRANIPHVIVVSKSHEVRDTAAVEFAKHFYTNFFHNALSVQNSFDMSKRCVELLVSSVEADKFKLCPEGHDHSQTFAEIIGGESAGEFVNETPKPPADSCDKVVEFFLGRSVKVQEVYSLLRRKNQDYVGARLVCIVGERGVGKTQVALRTCSFAKERHAFDKFCFINCTSFELAESTLVAQFEAQVKGLSSVSLATGGTVREVIESVGKWLDEQSLIGSVLVVLDGCDEWVAHHENLLSHFLDTAMKRLDKVYFMLTYCSLPVDAPATAQPLLRLIPNIVEINSLEPLDAATLFAKRCPHLPTNDQFYLDEINMDDVPDALLAFSRTTLLRSMDGNPRLIERIARLVGGNPPLDMTINKQRIDALIEVEKKLIREAPFRNSLSLLTPTLPGALPSGSVSPNHMPQLGEAVWNSLRESQRVVGSTGQAIVHWEMLKPRLVVAYRNLMGEEAALRPLSEADMQFLMGTPQWKVSNQQQDVPSLNHGWVSRASCISFFSWFQGIIELLQSTGFWTLTAGGTRIAGFITRQEAESKLVGRAAGTFLLRVSSLVEPQLVISNVHQTGKIEHILIRKGSGATFELDATGGQKFVYESFGQLVMSIPELERLCPELPKQDMFGL